MGMNETQAILHDIEKYIGAMGMAPSTFGRKAVNDGKLVTRLREGGGITLHTAGKIRSFMTHYRPARIVAFA
jgi:hypothetical protein